MRVTSSSRDQTCSITSTPTTSGRDLRLQASAQAAQELTVAMIQQGAADTGLEGTDPTHGE